MNRSIIRYPILGALPLFIDGLSALVLLFVLPDFATRLEKPSGWNALLLVIFYLLFCIGVYMIRKLEPWLDEKRWNPPSLILNPKSRAVLAFLFGLLMMTTVAYQIGYFESIQSFGSATLDEGDSSALLVYMPGALLGFSMLYILVLAFPVNSNVSKKSKTFPILAFIGLLLTNSMLLFTIAQAMGIARSLSLSNEILVYVASFTILFISYAPPRLLYQNKQPSIFGFVSLLFLILLAVWQIVR